MDDRIKDFTIIGKITDQVLPDESAARSKYLRIIDETGEDYC